MLLYYVGWNASRFGRSCQTCIADSPGTRRGCIRILGTCHASGGLDHATLPRDFPHDCSGAARNASHLLVLRHSEAEKKLTRDLRVSLSPKTSLRKRIRAQVRIRLPACCLNEIRYNARVRRGNSWLCGIASVGVGPIYTLRGPLVVCWLPCLIPPIQSNTITEHKSFPQMSRDITFRLDSYAPDAPRVTPLL
jgi:hypothetical protein